MQRFSIIGAAHLDVLAEGIDEAALREGSCTVEQIRLGFGGDAFNEAVVLSRLGGDVDLISKIGKDSGGAMVLDYCRSNGLDTKHINQESGLTTSMNLVLIDKNGERSFITDPKSSLRALTLEDVLPSVDCLAPVVCFASLFVFPKFSPQTMETLFSLIKREDRLICADMTKRKNGEKLVDLAGVWPYLDVLFANVDEAGLLSEQSGVVNIAKDFRAHGVKCVVIKTGANGCYIDSDEMVGEISGCRSKACVDTTGAGDTFAAGFLFARSNGGNYSDCARFANAIASICVEHVGATTHTIYLDDGLERCRENYSAFSDFPIDGSCKSASYDCL